MCANFLYILLTLYFLYRIASHFGGHIFGWGAVFSFLLTPIFLQYLVRANLEHALNLATMAGFYAFVRSQTSHGYKIFFIAALAVAGFVKGVGAIVLPLVALTYWAVALRSARSLFLIFAAGLVLLFLAAGFEIWYRETTDGVSFWWNYLHLQRGHVNPLHFFNNFFWYLPRVMWFAAPWVFYVLYGVYRARKSDVALLRDRFFVVSCLAATLVVFLYSLFDRRADRYIFSAYCLLAISGGWALLRLRPRVVELFKERQEVLPYWLSSALVILTLLRIGFHTQHQGWGWGE
jgi:4-amino-4-deoxy-L-arabinose transferase-like glycosyltransferase